MFHFPSFILPLYNIGLLYTLLPKGKSSLIQKTNETVYGFFSQIKLVFIINMYTQNIFFWL